jgi:hypothetical protein
MAKNGKQILDIEYSKLKTVLLSSKNFREALLKLDLYYCTNSITRVRVAAKYNGIDISHLEKRSRNKIDEAEAQRVSKIKKRNSLNKRMRNGPVKDYSYFILYDSRKNDKINHRENNLTLDFIIEKLSGAKCSYCEDSNSKLTLDRIDNNKGHTTDNVNVACISCNTIRNSIPYAAWIHMVPLVKSAKELGLFEGWKQFNKKKV